ncbi:MAG: TonB-dependent receptor [Prevotella sp.]|jgi:TonB-linked SusC/RagA family outer membrane protein|nr:TonB-dependent receptor [Prevotella sp.]
MKNNDLMGVFWKKYPELKQLTRIMRIFVLCLLCSVQMMFAADSFSQNARVTMNLKNVQLAKVLSEIESQTNYLFIYNNQVEVKQATTVNVKDKPTSEVLDQVLKNTNINYSMEGSHIILSTGAVASTQNITQQDRLVTGTIKDKNGEPLIGVSVAVKGTTIGTMTDLDGNFSIRVPEGKTLEVTYIGYVTQTLTGNQSSFNVILQESDVNLDEVVVTALGIKRAQKALSYNVQEIKGEELTGVKDPNFMNSLSGKVAGVNINASSAGIGGATRVVMRGSKSITKDNNALYVIDGVPIFNASNGGLNQNNEYADQPRGEGIADLNPDDIESMSVLTGPAAAALYGSNAANGAIVITTKKGATGKPKVTISNQTTFSRPFVSPDFQSKYGNRTGEYRSWGDIQNKYSYDPMDFFDTGATVQTSATLSVGTDKNQTYMSLGSTSSNGIIPENEYSKYNVTLRNTTKFLNDKMTLDFGFSYIKQKDQNMMAQGQYYNPLTAVYTYPRGEDFGYAKNYEVYNETMGYNEQQWKYGDQGLGMQNPYWVINRNRMTNKRDRYMMNVNLQYDILDWMNVMGRARLDNSHNNYAQKNYATTNQLFASETGRFKSTKEDYKQVYADLLLNINKYFGDYSLSANIGTSISDMRSDESGVDGASLKIPNFFAITNIDKDAPKTKLIQSGWHEQTQSVFANFELGWKSMLYLTLTGRNDWASALANTSNSSFFYPSVGVSGVISEMVNMPSFITYMKVRGSYSSVGSAIPRNLSIPTYEYDEQGGFWKTNTYMPIKDLKPERTGSWEAGLSTKFWNNRLSLDLTWYKSNTKNQTLEVPVSASTGYSSMYIQTGDVENQGVEITLGADNRWGDFNWNSTFTASYNKNTIKQLGRYADPITGEMINLEYISQGGIGSSEFRLMSGGTMGDLWVKRKLKYGEDGSVVLGENGQPVLEDTMEKVGSVLPKWNLGFRNDFRWKDFNLGFLISARLGGIVMSPTQAILDGFGVTQATANARDNGGVVIGNTTIGAEQYYTAVGQTEGLLSDYVYKATNVRLQELTVGYNLPSKWFNDVMKVNVSFVGRNLWMIYNKAPFDPEATASTGTYFQGIDYFMQPSLRNLGFSVKVEF